ncbi:MAG: hypothetical protein IJH34_04790 [Romboutsia sp.]|nr:hypothetical protein [Romboutsia sp.]
MIKATDEIKNDFLIYAQEVNQNRAFPDARDGLKPSQRAALYTMYRKGFSSSKPHVKSAKITGAIIAELWPHGDVSAYDSIVRMSQPWVNNLPEVDFHGGNGSLIGGPEAASSRYTECRLSKASEDGFFSNIKKDTVDMIPNFSEDDEWPIAFPAVFPRLFVNGSQGIGYTIAQEWEPGNLNEFADKVKEYVKSKTVNCDNMYPDYPTGGVIINKKDIHTIYETGKGTVVLRGKVAIENNLIKITELPYQTYAEPLIAKIKELVNSEQITGIEDICNKSDDSGLLIEIECSEDPNIVVNKLYRLTSLQVSFSANQMALVDGVPQMLTLKDYIKGYVEHNIECIVREYKFDLAKAQNRLEIVDGLLKALVNIDEVISSIKKSKSSEAAKANLEKEFGFTKVQSQAIVDMKLGKLANLEQVELNNEQKELNKTVANCNKFIGSDSLQKKEFIKRLEAFVKAYGWERRTAVTDVDIVKEKATIKKTPKSEEQFMVVLTKGNYIKRVSLVNYKPQTKVKNAEDEVVSVIKVGAREKFILISETGMMYKLQTNKIPTCTMNSTGTSLSDLVNDKILNIYTGSEEDPYIFMITQNGLVKKMNASDVFKIGKNVGTMIMKLEPNDRIINLSLITSQTVKYTVGKKQYSLETDKFKTKGRSAGGVKGIKVKEGQSFELQ